MKTGAFNIIWVARANPDNKIIAAGETYEEANLPGQAYAKKHKTTFYLRTYAEVSEGQIYANHFNFCPHCGGKLRYREDEYQNSVDWKEFKDN